jgi:hypothetical protein
MEKLMQLAILDKSNYLKGLLIVIGKDKKITERERELLLKLAEIMGFSKKFCDDAMDELFENEYIIEEPPVFSNTEIAKAFFKDCLRLAFIDNEMHLHELNWIKSAGEKNNLPMEWRIKEFERVTTTPQPEDFEFEIYKLIADSN